MFRTRQLRVTAGSLPSWLTLSRQKRTKHNVVPSHKCGDSGPTGPATLRPVGLPAVGRDDAPPYRRAWASAILRVDRGGVVCPPRGGGRAPLAPSPLNLSTPRSALLARCRCRGHRHKSVARSTLRSRRTLRSGISTVSVDTHGVRSACRGYFTGTLRIPHQLRIRSCTAALGISCPGHPLGQEWIPRGEQDTSCQAVPRPATGYDPARPYSARAQREAPGLSPPATCRPSCYEQVACALVVAVI